MEIIVTNLRPTVSSVYGHGWEMMKKYFLPMFLLMLLTGIISLPAGMSKDNTISLSEVLGNNNYWNDWFLNFDFRHSPVSVLYKIFVLFYTLFIINPINYGAKYVRLKAIRDTRFEVREVFDVFKNYLNVVLAALLASSIIVIGFIFLIIPGIVFACRLAFVPYLVMDKKLDPVKAVEESWRMTRGHGFDIFIMGILAFFIGVAGFLCFIFGIVFSIIWISLAFASMYQAVLQSKINEESQNSNNEIIANL